MEDCINTNDYITVTEYAKNKPQTREQMYYYIEKGYLKSITISGVIFVKKGARIRFPKKPEESKLTKREQKAKAYLESEKNQ